MQPITSPAGKRTAELLRAGLTKADIQHRLDQDVMRRVSWGVYAPCSPEEKEEVGSPEHRRRDHVALARQLLPLFPGAYLVGLSACLAHGLPTLTIPERIHLAREPRVRSRRPEVMTHRAWTHPILLLDGMRVQGVEAAVLETAASAGLLAGLVPGDEAARRGLMGEDATSALAAFGSKQGAAAARSCRRLIDGRRESPLESWAAYQAHVAGISLVPQPVVRDAHGQWVARPDFRVADRNVLVEVDGIGKYSRHSDFKNERVRHNQIEELGWIVVRITVEDLRAGRFVPRLCDAIARSVARA